MASLSGQSPGPGRLAPAGRHWHGGSGVVVFVGVEEELESRCELLRSLHRPGNPLVLPNAWDVTSARAVAAAGFPVVATTSAAVASALGHEDHELAPSDDMFAAAARIARSVDLPVTVDAEAGYGLEPLELITALQTAGAAGCNLEDSDHAAGSLRAPEGQAAWLRQVRKAASDQGYGLVVNARIDVFFPAVLPGYDGASQKELLPAALERAHAYLEAGADCVFPIGLWERDVLAEFTSQAGGPVNILAFPRAPALVELAELGVARVSHGPLLHRQLMEQFQSSLASLAG